MLDPEVPDERRDQIAVDARKRIEAGGGLKQERAWGLRKMAYEINQRNEADYRFFRFEKGDSVLDELNHNLKITDGVLRFRIFKVDPRLPVIDPPPPISFAAPAGPRPGGRGRRDDDRGGRYEDRPPRGPEPVPEGSVGEASEAPSADVEPPAAPAPAEPTAAPSEPAPAEPPSEPAESGPEGPPAAEPASGDGDEQQA